MHDAARPAIDVDLQRVPLGVAEESSLVSLIGRCVVERRIGKLQHGPDVPRRGRELRENPERHHLKESERAHDRTAPVVVAGAPALPTRIPVAASKRCIDPGAIFTDVTSSMVNWRSGGATAVTS